MTELALSPSPDDVLAALFAHYGRPEHHGPDDLLGTLIRTIISQQTTSESTGRAFGELLDVWAGDWRAIHAAPEADIARAIAHAGLANQKAARIKALLARIHHEGRGFSLEFLREWEPERARDYLTSFKGVGPKTAAFTLMHAASMPLFPMDTHILRICKRLGWLPSSISNRAAHARIEPVIAPQHRHDAHMVLVEHGRQTCDARKPACARCPLRSLCPSATPA